MLGSLADAEDALQDTLLRAWRGLVRFEGRGSLRSWLYTIATNASLRAIESAPSACCRSTTPQLPIHTDIRPRR
jgi:DNA-directed RNA polymerase specialized sigma24 family protein